MGSMRACGLSCLLSISVVAVTASLTPAADVGAKDILSKTGIQGGFVVHVGCGDGRMTAEFKASDSFQVHGLDTDAANVQAARTRLQARGVYGRVAVDHFDGKSLPYIDQLVNLLVAEDLGEISRREVMRVLVPGGVAYIKENGAWQMLRKPRPKEMDEWTHYLHDSTGNAVAHDTLVGPPRHLQWVGSPRWSRHHDRMASMSAEVSAGGRVFYIMDEGSRVSIQLPADWKLIARDAFNGTILWKRDIEKWHSHLWPLKSGPTQLARRLVTDGKRVYATLSLRGPLVALDAATGETLRTYPQSASTEEILHSGGVLFAVVNEGESELETYKPQHNVGDQQRVDKEFHWNEKPRFITAYDAESGKLLWRKETKITPLTLAADGDRLFFYDGEKIVSLNRKSGEQVWTTEKVQRRSYIPMNFGPKLVVQDGVLLFAGGDRKMTAYAAQDGKQLWTAPHAQSGYKSPEDVLVVRGLVWNAPTTSGRDSGVFTGRDLHTGEVKVEFPPNVETYWFHHRCYMAKATDKYLLPSRTGIEFVDPDKKDWEIHHWVRGGCLYGIMPCNGLVYAGPHNCACYPEAKLYGVNALAPASKSRNLPDEIDETNRLEKGPALGKIEAAEVALSEEWPVFRHDPARSGRTTAKVPAKLRPAWSRELGGRLSTVTVADGKLFVAQIDQHAVHALSADTGQPLWSYTTGGRVDSPPTWHAGTVLFGSADGWVYCLRAKDGQLAWRFRAAPQDKRLMAFEQLESVWPVHGSILVDDGVAYFVAGRSYFLDGGLRLFRLDAKTGQKLSEHVLDEKDPETGENLQKHVKILNMPVGLPDVLTSDGEYIYMRSQRFDKEGNRLEYAPHSGDPVGQAKVQQGEGAHLFSPTGFLDGSYFHRSYWVYGRSFAGGHSGYSKAGKFAPAGRLLVFDDERVYGFGRKPEYLKWTTILEHQLFATDKQPKILENGKPRVPRKPQKGKKKRVGNLHPEHHWTQPIPLLARAMILADKTLFVAGPPDLVDEAEAFEKLTRGNEKILAQLAEQDAAIQGKQGGLLIAVSTENGKTIGRVELASLPTWDGLAAAHGRLYLSTTDGKIVCLGE